MKNNMTDKEFLENYCALSYSKALDFLQEAEDMIESARIVMDAYKTCVEKAAKMPDEQR